MSCVPAVDEQEQRFLTALGQTHAFAIDGGTLVLFDTTGTPVLRLSPLDGG
jgi:heat shock protein HslJ